MTALADFADWPLEDISWQVHSTRDQYGQSSYAAAVTGKAYVVYHQAEIRANMASSGGASGGMAIEERNALTWVYILDAPNLSPEDKVILPDGSTPRIQSVRRVYDEQGQPYYTKVEC